VLSPDANYLLSKSKIQCVSSLHVSVFIVNSFSYDTRQHDFILKI